MPVNELIRAGVIGWPVGHSLSPRLHGFWLRQYGIHGTYEPIALEPERLKEGLLQLAEAGYAGCNLTLPHKELALSLMDTLDPLAESVGAVNTVIIRDGKFYGSNTDIEGFIRNLTSNGIALSGQALVLGAGGAARAVCAGLSLQGMRVIVANRTREKAELLAADLNIESCAWETVPDHFAETSLLVNATLLGMKGHPPLHVNLDGLPQEATVTDIVYSPLITPLLQDARDRGHKIVDGLGMLLYQARPGFAAWFGVEPEVTDELRAHVLAGLYA